MKNKKSANLISYIKEMMIAGHYPPESKIPSIRQLMEQFDLSFSSVKRGVDALVDDGFLEKVHGKGIFVRKFNSRNSNNRFKISVFLNTTSTRSYCARALVGMQQIAEEQKCSIQINYVYYAELNLSSFLQGTKDADGIIFLGPYDYADLQLPLKIPAVSLVMHDSMSGRISNIDLDPVLSAQIACKYFSESGINEINVVSHYYPSYKFRHEVFMNMWREAGGKATLTIAPDTVQIVPEQAYFFTSASVFQEYSEYNLHKTGKILSETNATLAMDGKNIIDPDFHYTPCISPDWEDVGKLVMNECLRRVTAPGSSALRIYVPGRLYVKNNIDNK